MPVTRPTLAALCLVLAACGSPPAPADCIHVDGRGGAGADGSEARPLRTIAEALAIAPEDGVICLSVGEHASPGSVAASVTIRGADPGGGPLPSALLPPAGDCALAVGLDTSDLGGAATVDASAVIVTEGDADVRLERLAIGGCDHAVVARARSTTVSESLLTRARVGVAADRGAELSVIDTAIAVEMALGADEITCGVCGGTGARIAVRGTDVDGGSRGWAIAGALGTLEVEATTLHHSFAGLAIGGPGVVADRVSIGPGTLVRELAGVALAGDVVTANLIVGARSVEIRGARFEASGTGALGLQIADAESARIEDTQLLGHDYASLGLVGGSFVIGEGVELGARGEGVALIAGGVPERETGPTALRIEGALTSTGTDGVRHVLVQGTGALELLASATLSGGAIGVQGLDTGAISGTGAWTVRDVSGAAVSLTGEATATLANLDARVLAGARGVDLASQSSLTLLDGAIGGGLFGVHARERTAIALTGVTIDGGAEAGIVIEGAGGATTLSDVEVIGAALGVSIRDGRSATARDLVVTGSAASGIEVVGATLDLMGGRLEGNRGAGIVFEDGAGAVRGLIFRGTMARSDDRADEVRLVSTDGEEHVVEIAENMFEIASARSCAGGCSVVFASGTGVRGIVRPNCLTATPGVSDTFTLCAQDGARLEEPVPAVWADGLLGRTADLGWLAGSSLTPAAPSLLESANVDAVQIPAGL